MEVTHDYVYGVVSLSRLAAVSAHVPTGFIDAGTRSPRAERREHRADARGRAGVARLLPLRRSRGTGSLQAIHGRISAIVISSFIVVCRKTAAERKQRKSVRK